MRSLITLFSLVLIISCTETKTSDPQLVGTWTGGNPDRSCGSMWWKLTRTNDGLYDIWFYSDAERVNLIGSESGEWWTSNSTYYAINPNVMSSPDQHQYQLLSENKVEMISKKFDETAACSSKYKFIDTKL